MKMEELRKLSTEELNNKIKENKEELFNLQQKHLELTRKLDIFNVSLYSSFSFCLNSLLYCNVCIL